MFIKRGKLLMIMKNIQIQKIGFFYIFEKNFDKSVSFRKFGHVLEQNII